MSEEFKGVRFNFSTKPELGDLMIDTWPDQKQVSVNIVKGSGVQCLAHFSKPEYAAVFVDWMSNMLIEHGLMEKRSG